MRIRAWTSRERWGQQEYYGYYTKPFKKYLSIKTAKGYLKRLMLPKGAEDVKFSPELYKRTVEYLTHNDPKMIYIYGDLDPWGASGVAGLPFTKNKTNLHVYVCKGGSHRARILSHSPNPPDRKSSTSSADGWRNRQRTGKLIWSNWRPNTLIWKSKENFGFSLLFSLFALSLDLQPQDTHVRQSRRKNAFPFAFRSLNRIINPSDFRYSRSAKQKKKSFFFCFSLT